MNEDLLIESEEVCRFCVPPDGWRVIHQSDNFYIMLSLGPVTEGYLLLVSKKHFDSCASIPEELAEEFDSLYHRIRSVLTEVYGCVVSYEHGRAGSCLDFSGSKHCYHAHMHFVPVNKAINEIVSLEYVDIPVKTLAGFREEYVKERPPYLFVHDDKAMKIYKNPNPVMRQYLRRVVATAINKEELWDWANFQNLPLIESGRAKLIHHFNQE